MNAEASVGHWHVRVSHDLAKHCAEVTIVRFEGDVMAVMTKATITSEKLDPGVMMEPEPFMSLPEHEVKDLIRAIVDAAWEYGVKPSKVNELSAGENLALRSEVQFLREVVMSIMPPVKSMDKKE